jgi:hypothetical protein
MGYTREEAAMALAIVGPDTADDADKIGGWVRVVRALNGWVGYREGARMCRLSMRCVLHAVVEWEWK